MPNRSRMGRAMLRGLAGISLMVHAAAYGAEITLQNDSLQGGQNATICPCFAPNEEAAVWLTTPCDGNIVAIQVFWRSFLGGQQAMIEDSIMIYSEGNFPTPGALLPGGLLEAPVLTDGVINEYRYYDDNQTIPISIPVTAGQTFVVSFKFFNASPPLGPSISFDNNGAVPFRNAVKAIGQGWVSAGSLGVSGDWIIRAVVDCAAGDPVGACCLPDGSCEDNLTSTECAMMSGSWRGAGSICAGLMPPCPQPTGACCFPGGGCLTLTEADCIATSVGSWAGPFTACPDACIPDACDGDADGSGAVDIDDLTFVVLRLGDPAPSDADVDGSGTVDLDDVTYVVLRLGTCN